MITYPVDVENTRWAVYQVSTGEIVGRNKLWPVADGSEIPGLDPDYVYLLHVNDTPPDYDARLYTLTTTEGIDVDGNELHLTYATEKRPTDEQINAAENEETAQLAKHVDLVREVIETRLMLGALLVYVVDAQAFPAKAQAMSDAYKAKAIKLWKNRDRLEAIIAEITAGTEPNLDEGWEAP